MLDVAPNMNFLRVSPSTAHAYKTLLYALSAFQYNSSISPTVFSSTVCASVFCYLGTTFPMISFFHRWSFSNRASVPTLKRSHWQRCKMRKARHLVINTVRKGRGRGEPTVHSHDSSSSETSNKTSLLSAPPWREGSQWKLVPSSSSELPSQTQSLLETSF